MNPYVTSLLSVFLLASVAHAQTTERYTVSFQGKVTGKQTVTTVAGGRIVVDLSFSNNGRGPDLHEEMAIDAEGRLQSYRVTGKSEFGASISESFDRVAGKATWKSRADEGGRAGDRDGQYVPLDSSVETLAVIARALLQQPTGQLPALPAGQLTIRKLRDAPLAARGERMPLTLYAIFGLDVSPGFVWLQSDPAHRLFAQVEPGFAVIQSGWEDSSDELLRLQKEAERELLGTLAASLAHRFGGPILIRNVKVFDAEAGAMREPSDVYVHRGRIAAIFPAGADAREPATIIDGTGRYLVPGLFDMHAHEWPWNALLQIAGGVTTVRDMGNDNKALDELRNDIDSGRFVGPRVVPAGFIEGDSPYAARLGIVVKNPDEAKAAVDWYAQRGYRQIKLYNSIRPEWVVPIAAYAHTRGMRVSGHIPAFMRAEEAVRDGYDEIQHINQVMLNFLVKPGDDTRTLLRFYLVGDNANQIDFDSPEASAFFKLLVAHGTAVDPTIAIHEQMFTQRQGDPNPAFGMVASHVPPTLRRFWLTNSININDTNAQRFRASYDKLLELTRRLHAAGVPLVAGTDNIAGFTLHRELEIYVLAGIAPAEVLQIATRNAAKIAGVSDTVGVIGSGKYADLILVDEDPTREISAIRKISMVMKEGVVYYPAEIYEAVGVARFSSPPTVTTSAHPTGQPR